MSEIGYYLGTGRNMPDFQLTRKETIKKIARRFRKAILSVKSDEFQFGLFSLFPQNCCEYTSYFLGRYLVENCGFKDLKLITAENKYKTKIRHSWLDNNGLFIDITANQFSSTDRTVFVTFDSRWHYKRFKIIEAKCLPVDWSIFHNDARDQLETDYQAVLFHIRLV